MLGHVPIMRLSLLSLCASFALMPLAACADAISAGDGAADIGVIATIDGAPEVMIDDEFGTDVRMWVDLAHMGGPDAETLEIVSASLHLDHEHYADIDLAIPADHPSFAGLADGEEFSFALRGHIPASHDDWTLCNDPETYDADEQRISLQLELRVTPGVNGEEDEFGFESLAVDLGCSHTG